ncbi:MAG: translin family protein [Thermoplasmata archaeon]
MPLLDDKRAMELNGILDDIESEMEEKDTVRELAMKSSRAMARLSVNAIGGLHRDDDVRKLLEEAREEARRLRSLLQEHPDVYYSGFVENAHQEVTEAAIAHSLITDSHLPRPEDLAVTGRAYVLGLGDVVGELRRYALERLKEGEVKVALEALEAMETIYEGLMRFNYPTALMAIKRKQDIARSLLEKTRGEVVVALRSFELEKRLDELKERE